MRTAERAGEECGGCEFQLAADAGRLTLPLSLINRAAPAAAGSSHQVSFRRSAR